MSKKKKILLVITFLVFVLLTVGYFYLDREMGNPRENFEAFFKVFKKKYALFDIKGVNWESVYKNYSAGVNENTTDKELFEIFHQVMKQLNDKHCYIYKFNRIYFSGFDLPPLNYLKLLSFDFRDPLNDFSIDLIRKNYLKKGWRKTAKIVSLLPPFGIRNIFTMGWLEEGLAYVHMTEMSNRTDVVEKAIAEFFKNYGHADGFVIDIRDNIGGYSGPVKKMAERFSSEKQVFAVSRLRNPGNIYKFMEPEFWEIGPPSEGKFIDKPVAVLTNGNTQSAAELFTLIMKTMPNAVVIGTGTAGVFADTHVGKLPNGWEYRLSVRKTNDAADISWEGKGLTPDIKIGNTEKDITNGRDNVIVRAVDYLKDIIRIRGRSKVKKNGV